MNLKYFWQGNPKSQNWHCTVSTRQNCTVDFQHLHVYHILMNICYIYVHIYIHKCECVLYAYIYIYMCVVRFNASIVFWRLATFFQTWCKNHPEVWTHDMDTQSMRLYQATRSGDLEEVEIFLSWHRTVPGYRDATSSQYYSGCFTLQEPVQRSFLVGFLLVGWEPKNVVFFAKKSGGRDTIWWIEKVATKVTGVILWLVAWSLLGLVLVVVLCCLGMLLR